MFCLSGFSVCMNGTFISVNSPKIPAEFDSCPQALQRSNGQWCRSALFLGQGSEALSEVHPMWDELPKPFIFPNPSLGKLNCVLCLLKVINMFFLVQKALCLLLSSLVFCFKQWCFLSRVCLFQTIRIYPGKKLIACFLEAEAPTLFSLNLWNLAGKNTSRTREKHFLLYEILFSFGWDVNLLISLFSTLFLSETLAVCQNINGVAWHTVPLWAWQVALAGTWASQGTLREDLCCTGLVMQYCLLDSCKWTKK